MTHHNKDKIQNRAFLDVESNGDITTFQSNQTIAHKLDVELAKEQSHSVVHKNQLLHYKIKITNKSCSPICDAIFRDILDEDSEYVHGTFSFDGHPHTPIVVDHRLIYIVPKLYPHKEAIVAFAVKIK